MIATGTIVEAAYLMLDPPTRRFVPVRRQGKLVPLSSGAVADQLGWRPLESLVDKTWIFVKDDECTPIKP